jgi:hypothetical protein
LATKRRRVARTRIDRSVPPWAERMLAGHGPPAEGEDGFDEFFDWLFLNIATPGLPDPMSDEGCKLWQRSGRDGDERAAGSRPRR